MNIDILHFTEAQWNALNYTQRKTVYDAQTLKNEMRKELETSVENAKLKLLERGTARSNMLAAIINDLQAAYETEVRFLAETTYDAVVNGADASPPSGGGSVPTDPVYNPASPDTTLSELERFKAVKDYYLAISNPTTRYNAFLADTSVRSYLGDYYQTMDNYLRSFLS